MSWSDGYVTEIDYTRGYYRELAPVHQSFALIAKGLRVPALGSNLRYLELGFGQGMSLNIHAAANRGEFWGTDFNPAQAASAQDLAEASGNGARIFDHSFQELAARTDLPEFDMIGMHGIYSWISVENRAAIVEIIRRHLKPGGVVYISYNCQPGWAAAAPLSHLLRLHARFAGNQASPVTKRVEDAFGFARQLEEAGARYFAANPGLKARIERTLGMDKTYLAHEYLNEHWHPMHFDEIARELEPAKLAFGASAGLADHLDLLNLTDKGREALSQVTNPVLRESLRDFLTNQQFRRDLWVRGVRTMTAVDRIAALKAQRVVAMRSLDPEKLPEIAGSIGTAKLDEKTNRPIVEMLASAAKPLSLGEIESRVCAQGITIAQVVQGVLLLGSGGHVAAAHDDATIQAVSKRCAALNKVLLRDFNGSGTVHLASPVTGGGVPVGAVAASLIQCSMAGRTKAEDLGADLWKQLSSRGHKLVRDGKTIETAEENRVAAVTEAQQFLKHHYPNYRRLGLV